MLNGLTLRLTLTIAMLYSATGRPWPVAADDARLALRAALRLTSAYVNPDTAHGHTGGYDLRIRGGPRVVIRFTDGRASLEQPGDVPVDCHILAAPGALLLVLYGRIPSGDRSPRANCSHGAADHGGPWASSNYSSTPNRYLQTYSPGASPRRIPAF